MSCIRPAFQATYRGRSIWSYSLPSGIRHAAPLTWIGAAHWDHKSYDAFCEMDGEYQSYIVAAYLTSMQEQAVEADQAGKKK